MQRCVLASNNAGKIREFNQLLNPYHLEVVAQRDLGIESAEETGLTFVENAILKARHASQHSGLPALADDSGIEVDALNGQPGIYSARFAGPDASDEENNQKLLTSLAGVPEARRTARYHCVLVWLRHAEDPVPLICHGSWEGRILEAPQGTGGFGYDPLFWLPDLGCTAAELSPEQKNRLSHRGQALHSLLSALQSRL
ncbi:MAG: RdgB/HAM1 family non-canonical purine NTP pyrophosphatase [Gammaproteobacteria bacterium]|nr:MAG: RdgB/HAM1 family non-canonical purine NTP pyrophosphatase [Gammaproteobacteria bacterium]